MEETCRGDGKWLAALNFDSNYVNIYINILYYIHPSQINEYGSKKRQKTTNKDESWAVREQEWIS